MQLPKSNLSEIQLLRKEIEALGDDFDRHRLDEKSEIDRLKVQIESLKATLREIFPQFDGAFSKAYSEELQNFDPEAEKLKKTG